MKGIRFRIDPAIVVALAVLCLIAVGGSIRESDQASLLDGGLRMARGEMPVVGASAYNYDKLFVSYWVIAALFRGAVAAGVEIGFENVGVLGNAAGALLFWSGALALAWRRDERGGTPLVMFLAALAAPAVLLSSVVLSANMISGGILLWLAAVAGPPERRGWVLPAVAGVLSFLAVGARADAVLCLPFLCWVTVRRATWGALFASRRNQLMGAGAVAALAAGFAISEAPPVVAHAPMENFSVAAAYLVFGLGGAGIALLGALGLIAGGALRGGSFAKKGFYVAGGIFALLPLAYYGPQLYTPRHLVGCAWILIFFATLWRGRALLRGARRRASRGRAIFTWALGAGAAVPMVLGLHLPETGKPGVAIGNATLFPSADGLWPMGACVEFATRLRKAATEPIDHNQGLWRSLASVEFEEGADGFVPVWETPLRSYFELAGTIRRKRVRIVGPGRYAEEPFLYGDERSLLRAGPAKDLVGSPKAVVSGKGLAPRQSRGNAAHTWHAVLRIEPGAGADPSDPAVERRLALAGVFEGNEFRTLGDVGGVWSVGERADRGKTIVYYSEAPFAVEVRGGGGEAAEVARSLDYPVPGSAAGRLYVVVADAARTRDARYSLVTEKGAAVFAARTVLPDYMSVNDF